MSVQEEKYVKWATFVWVVSIVTVLIGALFMLVLSQMDSFSDMKSDVSSIKTDVSWIKSTLDNKKSVSIN